MRAARWDVGPSPSASDFPGGAHREAPSSDISLASAASPPVSYSHAYTLRDTNMRINGLCFSSDGSLLFLSSWDCSLHIHDVRRCVCIRSLHAHRHGIESLYLLPNNNHLCLCPTKLQGPFQQNKGEKQQPAAAVGGGAGGGPTAGGLPQGALPYEGGGKQQPAGDSGALLSWAPPPSIGKEGGNSYNLRLWDLRENRYVRVIPVSGRVIPGTGVCVHPRKSTFFCCTDDGFIKYYCSEKETYMWKRPTRTRRPLAAVESEGLVAALYEGEGRVSLWDINYLSEPFLTLNISPFLLNSQQQQQHHQHQQQTEVPTSLNFSPDGSLMILGTDRDRFLAVDSFTGQLAGVWTPPGGPSRFGSRAHLSGSSHLGVTTGAVGSSPRGSSSVCYEGFVPAIDLHTDTLLCGATDGWVYGYDLRQAQREGAPPGPSCHGEPFQGPPPQEARLCPKCAGRQGAAAERTGRGLSRPFRDDPQHECYCSISYRSGVSLGPHWGPPLWVAANPKHAVVATAGINCSVWRAEIG